MTVQLGPERLDLLPPTVRRPSYDPVALGVGIAHIGLGAFHRAHQACYVDEMLARAGGDWRISAVACHSRVTGEQLHRQGGLYAVAERAAESTTYRVVGALADVLHAPSDPERVLALIARPATRLVSLTITEKAYRATDPDLQADRATPHRVPASAIGLLTAGLRRRLHCGVPAPTVLSCDNLRENGRVLREAVLEHARHVEGALADWIESKVSFPNTMVDRIVPATTDADRDAAMQALGMRDEALVVTEPFSQWIIEDAFAGPRPPLDVAGAQFVRDVRPFEVAKLRLLNGSHSTLAYAGVLAGHEFVHQAIADDDLRGLVERLMVRELSPTLSPAPGLDLHEYRSALLERFANAALGHRLMQIAMDGSQKLPQRLLAPLEERLARGEAVGALCFVIAAWMCFVARSVAPQDAQPLEDPLAGTLQAAARQANGDAVALVRGLLHIESLFNPGLAEHASFTLHLARQVETILRLGVRQALRDFLSEPCP